MKITAVFLALCVSVACSTNLLANASESQDEQPSSIAATENIAELQKTSFNLWVHWDGHWHGTFYWANFKWRDDGNNNVVLWPTSGGEFMDPSTISPNITLRGTYTVIIRDENYREKSRHSYRGALRGFVDYLKVQRLRLGKDSIQILPQVRDHLQVVGKVEQFGNINFFDYPTQQQLRDYAFVPRAKSLRAFYLHQDRIEDGKYRIAYENEIYLTTDLLSSNNVFVHYGVEAKNSTWKLVYDSDKLAYRALYTNGMSLAWDPKSGNNVFVYSPIASNDQYWMFKKIASTGKYAIFSAVDVYNKYLNVDQDFRNVSVSKLSLLSNQQFTFTKQ